MITRRAVSNGKGRQVVCRESQRGFFLLLFLLSYIPSAYGMSELEKTYKERMDSLAVDALLVKSRQNIASSKSATAFDMKLSCDRYNSDMESLGGRPKNCGEYNRAKEQADNERRELEKKRDALLKEADDIKIKLLEKFGKLPKWWKASRQKLTEELYGK